MKTILILFSACVLFLLANLTLSLYSAHIFEQRLNESVMLSRQYMEANRIQPELISNISFAISATGSRIYSSSILFSIGYSAVFSALLSVLLFIYMNERILNLKSQIEELKKEIDSRKLNA